MKVFIGYDPRQRLSYHVLAQSILENASLPIEIIALRIEQLPIKRQGLTPFTYSRFLVPFLCNYYGHALFLDSDMVVTGDIVDLFAMVDDSKAVMVRREGMAPFEWASLMLFNCAHPANRVLTPEAIDQDTVKGLHKIGWVPQELVGEIPKEWNYCVGYDAPAHEMPKLLHYTQGNPMWPETVGCDRSDVWLEEFNRLRKFASWPELMGRSVHAKPVMERLQRQQAAE